MSLETDEAGFLEAICRSPTDDTVRLIYADWLDDNADSSPRRSGMSCMAEFIRTQIKLHNKPCHAFMYSCHENGLDQCKCVDFGDYDALRVREQELFRDPRLNPWDFLPNVSLIDPSWTMTCSASEIKFRVGSAEGTQDIWCGLRRGFVEAFELRFDDWLAFASRFVWSPTENRPYPPTALPITHVTISDRVPWRWITNTLVLAGRPAPHWVSGPSEINRLSLEALRIKWPLLGFTASTTTLTLLNELYISP